MGSIFSAVLMPWKELRGSTPPHIPQAVTISSPVDCVTLFPAPLAEPLCWHECLVVCFGLVDRAVVGSAGEEQWTGKRMRSGSSSLPSIRLPSLARA